MIIHDLQTRKELRRIVHSTVTPVSPGFTIPGWIGVGHGTQSCDIGRDSKYIYAYTKAMPEFARLRLWRSLSFYHHKRRPSKLLSDCVVFQIQNDSSRPGRPIFTSKEDGYEATSVSEI